jgi:exopolyphosphatase/guanosine-5'-triphosphate,3'-diphosphate pyrophosphatase
MNAPHQPLSNGTTRQVAVIDIGTRAIRLDVAEIDPAGRMKILVSSQKPANLGKDTFTEGRIEPASIEECVDIVKDFRHVAAEFGITAPSQITAVTTSSMREADNCNAFLDRVYIATGINVEVLEDPEVEHLIHLSLRDILEQDSALARGDVMVVEVGGGTTRLLLIQEGYVTYSGAFRLGSLRTRETLAIDRMPAERLRAVLDQHLLRTINQMRQSVPIDKVPYLIALAGDTESAMSRLLPGWDPAHLVRLSLDAPSLAEKIVATPVETLMRKHHLPSQEAETAGHALLAYDRIARAFGVREIMVTDKSLRRGLLQRIAGSESSLQHLAAQLTYSALALGRKYRFDERHALFVTDLSLKLFHELQAEHRLGPRYEILLKTAAILHDIGAFVGNAGHHKHSMYLIQNSEIFSLPRADTALVALVARYHRRALPLPTHPEYMQLDREDRLVVNKLAAILRLADALDRSHTQKYRQLAFAREERQFVIAAQDVEDITIERAALRDKGTLFEAVYGLGVALRAAQSLKGSVFNE